MPYGRQAIGYDDIQAVVDVLKPDWLTTSPAVVAFENSVADYAGARFAVAFCNGTAALHGIMHASGIKHDDEVITTPMTFATLEKIWCESKLISERDHVTPYIHKRPEFFRIGNMENGEDLSALRWTVDEPEDYRVICEIYGRPYPVDPESCFEQVLSYVSGKPELAALNSDFKHDEGYRKSLNMNNQGSVGR